MRCPECSRPLAAAASRCPYCHARIPMSELPTSDLGAPEEPGGAAAARRGAGAPHAAPALAPGSLFASRFMIVEKIGEGGMGEVYKAIDTRLDGPVALKMIRASVARQAGSVERFKDEVRIARQITHRSVSRVHDLGDIDGQVYLSMEWIQGETLRQLLRRAGALEPDRALAIGAEIASALDAAHQHGVIHRDLKPENVMIDERGDVHVLDFGIAVLVESQGRAPAAGPLGTPGYMAPEQKRGEPLDARADLFALGVILVEMLTGEHAENPYDALARLRPGAARGLATLVQSLIVTERERRASSAAAVADSLRALRQPERRMRRWGRVAAWTAVAACVIAAGVMAVGGRRPRSPAPPISVFASSPGWVYYQRGSDYLRNRSETMPGLESAITMLHRAVEADANLAIAWAALGEAYWRRFEKNSESSSRDEASSAVDRALAIDAGLPEAHNARGRGFLVMGRYDEARREFQRAVAARRDFDVAWANLGTACQGIEGGYDEGLKALKKAITLEPSYFRHWIYLGLFHERFGEWADAMIAYRTATELKPDSIASWNNLGGALLRLRNGPDAVKAFERSLSIQESPESHTNLGNALYYAGRYQEASAQYRLATNLDPRGAVYWKNLGDAETMLDRTTEARQAYLRARDLARERANATPLDPQAHRQLAILCAKTRDDNCALSEGARAAELAPGDASIAFANAVIRCLLGRHDEALDLLERAARLGYARDDIENDPDLRPLHGMPRYRRIVELAG
jgi:serine/threonine protein kinase/Flp pilus assembly protein TadD